MEREIKQSWYLPQKPEVVWDYLTRPDLIAQWLMQNDFKPVVGHKFMFTTKPLVKIGFDGKVYCEVLTVEPYKQLSYSWRGGPRHGKITLDSVVVWTLVPKDKGTELILQHKGFKGIKNFMAYFFMKGGWGGKIRRRLTELVTNVSHK